MKIEIRYYSRSGNTKKVADAIGEEVEVIARDITDKLLGKTDILFLGGALYWSGVDNELKSFINNLDNSVKKVAIFSTASIAKSAYGDIKKLLEAKNIYVYDNEFHCRGEFKMLHRGRPNADDLNLARKFARSIVK
ncbi:flavodoxin [Clostridium sp. SHJSY1]|uniref:flavodoxin family protein n=1 Tax=Clostridium sp. SHJSY1 TaxID=2942483 RepID=UPI00287548EA|nr:flavodoxin family protein [Clostridium sp. SHJSY1]MDS0527640.1 flavodoxin [Clostridium sp. SHJSY1]